MPCFTVGAGFARGFASLSGVPLYTQSHQHGHIAAAIWSAGRLDLLERPFLAFHVSGGTTEALLCTPDDEQIFRCERILASSDLKAGQAIDRVGVMLGLAFPAGRALDELSLQCEKTFYVRPSVKDGNPSLSGIQNRCEALFRGGVQPAEVARYCLESVSAALLAMRGALIETYPGLPEVWSGGVTANTLLRTKLGSENVIFAEPAYASDNAVGAAVIAAIKDRKR